MKVSAIIVTRGDVDLAPILDSFPTEWERIVWDNGHYGWPHVNIYKDGNDWRPNGHSHGEITDLAVYGRYAAIEHTEAELIYVQDDDCVVSDPQALVNAWEVYAMDGWRGYDFVVCNMPANFRHSFYQEHSLVGFGACFHRDAPFRAFALWDQLPIGRDGLGPEMDFFRRTCDIVFTTLTPRVLVDVPYEDLPWATADNRMWKQPTHRDERQKMLDLCLKVRDADS